MTSLEQANQLSKEIKLHNESVIATMITNTGILQIELETFNEKLEAFACALDTKDPEIVKQAFITAFNAFDPANSRVVTLSSHIRRLKL